jgi:hypothetical protein
MLRDASRAGGDHEKRVDATVQVSTIGSFRPGLVALTSAAFALDALYGVATHLIPAPAKSPKSRGVKVVERVKRGVSPQSLAKEWPRAIPRVFKERATGLTWSPRLTACRCSTSRPVTSGLLRAALDAP